jgi:hypothetical protein
MPTAVLGKPARYRARARHAAAARISFERVLLPILKRHCAVGTRCHAGDTAAARLRLDGSDPYAALVDARSSLRPTLLRVMPGRPSESVLWLKVTGKHKQAGIFGDQMPPGKPLPPSERRVIERWIRQGAPR